MVKRDFKSRYAGSVGGLVWSLLQPLWQLILFTWIFSVIIKFDLTGELTDNFAIYLFAGLIPWLAFNEGVTRSATAIIENGDLVKKVRFPAELLIFSVVIGALLHSAIAGIVFVGALIYTQELSLSGLYLLLLALPLQLALTLGLGFLTAALQVFFRDAVQLLTMLMTGWFYFTPIVFPLSALPDSLQKVLRLNPMTPLVELYRGAFLGGSLGAPSNYLSLVGASVLALALGMVVFKRLSPGFADEL
jgi:ABC-type polysaccharide/polyol phosphate export permease